MSGRCYLLRHGQSEWNVKQLTQGQTIAPPLTVLGRTQAQSAAAAIRADLESGRRVDVVRTSDLVRARQTAEIAVEELGGHIVLDPLLREQHLGDLEGRSYADTWAAAELHDWSDPYLPVAGGESPHQLRARMAEAFAHVDPELVTVLVSHGDAIRAVLGHLEGVDLLDVPWTEVPNGAVVRVAPGAVEWLARGNF